VVLKDTDLESEGVAACSKAPQRASSETEPRSRGHEPGARRAWRLVRDRPWRQGLTGAVFELLRARGFYGV
jgi:hypothetical protein